MNTGNTSNTATTAIIDHPDDDQLTAWWFLDLLAVEHESAPGMTTVVMEATLPLGSSPPRHVHENLDDTWYIIDGEMLIECGDEQRTVGTGEWVSLPRGVPHTFLVTGDRDARILLVHDNPSFRDFIRHIGKPAAERTVPPSPDFPPLEDLARIAASHDLTIVGPPLGLD